MALSAVDDRVRGLKAGGGDYLTKPFALDELSGARGSFVAPSS
jgi:two-component system OmpR family response regulator